MKNHVIMRQCGLDEYHKRWHTNDTNMIIYMHSDGGSIVCNERIYPIKKGALCFVGSKKYHYTMTSGGAAYERSKIFISNKELDRLLTFSQNEEAITDVFNDNSIVYAQLSERNIEAVDSLLLDISRYAEDDTYGDMIFASCFMRLLVFMSENALDKITLPHGSMYKAIEYINENIREDITVDSICEHVHTSKYHFCRSFKKATGLTVMNYILKTRITLAKNLLINESVSVGEISALSGFSNTSVFCRAFKANTSMTPLQYRRHKSRSSST